MKHLNLDPCQPKIKSLLLLPRATEEGGRDNKSSDRKPAAAHDASRKGDSYVPKMIVSLVIWKGSE
jgi:hypothetical protein